MCIYIIYIGVYTGVYIHNIDMYIYIVALYYIHIL